MQIRAGYEISYDCPQPTPMILTLSVHPSRISDLLTSDRMRLDPPIPQEKRGLDAARALFQISDVLFLGFANATQRSAETDSDAILRLFAGILKTRILQRELRRDDGELRVTIKPFQPVW